MTGNVRSMISKTAYSRINRTDSKRTRAILPRFLSLTHPILNIRRREAGEAIRANDNRHEISQYNRRTDDRPKQLMPLASRREISISSGVATATGTLVSTPGDPTRRRFFEK